MKLIVTENQLNKIIDCEIGEVDVKAKPKFGGGLEHRVYLSKKYPDKVFKVGQQDSVERAYYYYEKYPYLFPKVYGCYKLKNSDDNDYYLIAERLDTSKFRVFWGNLTMFSEEFMGISLYDLVYDIMSLENEWNRLLNRLKVSKKSMYDRALELYLLVKELNEIIEYPDLHNGQFGYDKDGVLKCLDF